MSLELYKEPPALRKQCRGTPLATYNSKHQVTTASKTVGNTTQIASYTYDNYGNITGVTLSAGGSLKVTSSAVYSDYGNYLTESINELGKTTTYNYDSVTKLLKYIQNANNVHTAYTYDNRDRTTKVYLDADKDGIADTAEAQVAYLYANNRLSGIDTATTDYTLTYDAFGNVLTIKAGNYTLATYDYASNNGKLLKLTYGNGNYEEYIYDSLERLVEVKFNGATEYIVKYDNNGRLYSLTENGATHIYEYDSLDRLVRAWQEDTNGNYIVAVENSYDDLGRAKGSTYVVGDRELSYTINYKTNSNLVSSLSMPRAANGGGLMSAILYSYDEFERLTTKEISLSTMASYYSDYAYYGYEVTTEEGIENRTTSLISSVTLRVSYGGNTTSTVYSYTYDNLGNITQIKKDGVIINEYTYDSLGQLVCEEDAVAGVTYIYYYDRAGNLTQKDSYPYAQGATRGDYISYLASQKQTVATYTYGNTTWGDMLTAYNGTAITYDAIGNPTNWRNASSLTWEGRKLISQTLNSDDVLTYTYNSGGIRTQKKKFDYITGEYRTYNYVLDGSTIIKETVTDPAYNLNYTLCYLYDESGVIGFIYNNQYYYYQKNLQGDIVRILNSMGTIVTEYTYDAWGNVLTTTGSLASTVGAYNPFRYRGYYYDRETGFYYLQSRYYDPTVGRFLNADGIVGANGGIEGYNMFAYCNNNPVNSVDVGGKEKIKFEAEFEYEYGTFTIELQAFGSAARPMAKAIDAGTKSITITLPNGVTVTIVFDKSNIYIAPNLYGILEQNGYYLYQRNTEDGITVGIVSYNKDAPLSIKGTYKPNVVDNDAHEDGTDGNDDVPNYSDNTPNAFGGDKTPSNPGSTTIDATEMDYGRFSGGGFNKDEFPLTIHIKR